MRIKKCANRESVAVGKRRDGSVAIRAENMGALGGEALDHFFIGMAKGVRRTHRNRRIARVHGIEKRLGA